MDSKLNAEEIANNFLSMRNLDGCLTSVQCLSRALLIASEALQRIVLCEMDWESYPHLFATAARIALTKIRAENE